MAIRPDEIGKARLDGSVALTQGVVFGVRYGRRVLLVVALVMRGDFGRKPLELGLGLRFRQLGRIRFSAHRDLACTDYINSRP